MRVSFTLSPLSLAAATWSRDLFSIHFPPPPPLPPPPSHHLLPPPSPAYLLLLSSLTFCIHFLSSDAPSTPPPTNPTLSPPQTALSVVFFPLFILQPSSFWLALMGGWRGDWKGMSTRREGGCRVMKGRVCDLSSVCVCEVQGSVNPPSITLSLC